MGTWAGGGIFLQLFADLEARLARHHHVEQDHVRAFGRGHGHGGGAVPGAQHLVSGVAQNAAQHGHIDRLVVHDQHSAQLLLHALSLRL